MIDQAPKAQLLLLMLHQQHLLLIRSHIILLSHLRHLLLKQLNQLHLHQATLQDITIHHLLLLHLLLPQHLHQHALKERHVLNHVTLSSRDSMVNVTQFQERNTTPPNSITSPRLNDYC
jgi:hypothetical protein